MKQSNNLTKLVDSSELPESWRNNYSNDSGSRPFKDPVHPMAHQSKYSADMCFGVAGYGCQPGMAGMGQEPTGVGSHMQ